MKKLLALPLALFLGSASADIKTVNVVWPFSPGSQQANMVRNLIESANKNQSKYKFIFLSKPGAGGSIAANYVKDSSEISILSSTDSFYIRPGLYENSHNTSDFSLVGLVCAGQPLGLYTQTKTELSQLKNREFTIGIIQGSITNLVSQSFLKNNSSFRAREVFYRGTVEATQDLVGGHIDMSVDLMGENVLSQFNNIKVLGITGTENRANFQTLKSLGIQGLDKLVVNYYLFVRSNLTDDLQEEFYKILNPMTVTSVQTLCEKDLGKLESKSRPDLKVMHLNNQQYWKSQTKDITKAK